ncbi:MAG: putative porin, partial [Cytophagales bacterium]|nr:putative porin [Cytophagales bacterium]
SYEKRTNVHFYQEYDLTKSKKALLFHRFDFTDQFIGYRETNTSSLGTRVVPKTFYPNTFVDSITTDQTTRFFKVENTFGVKSQSMRHFLSAYYTDRRFNYHQHFQTFTNDSLRVNMRSSLIGAEFSLRLADSLLLHAKAEFQPSFVASGNKLKDNFTNHFDNLLSAGIQWRFLEVNYHHTRISPTIFQTALVSNHFQWSQKLNPTTTDEIGAKVGYKLPWHTASVHVQGQNINDYIYFRQTDATPTQFGTAFQVLYVTGNVSFNWWKLGFIGLVRYSKSSLEETVSPIRFPTIYANPQIYFQSFIFKKALKFQFGLDAHYRTGYYADRYMPAIQTYFIQNDVILNNNWNMNVFLTAQIKRIRIFVRLNNIVQNTSDWGRQESKVNTVFTNTPGYFGIPFSFVFGFNWTFFD